MTSQTCAGLEEQVRAALETSPYLTRESLRCEACGGRVILHGAVGTYFQKQIATAVLRKVQGIDEIDNRLEVVWQ